MFYYSREEVTSLTPYWKGNRLPDGRPDIDKKVLERLRRLTLEEVWGLAFSLGYEFQAETDLRHTHEGKVLVGRAVTCSCVPLRQDLHNVASAELGRAGFKGGYNKAIVDNLIEDDVLVVDMFDKISYGTFLGGNLTTMLKKRTVNGGAVVWGGIRDLDQIRKMEDIQIYYRGVDPTPIRDYVMISHNGPVRIGNATCLPGDIVFGTSEGVVFVPAQFAEMAADRAEKRHLRDEFGFAMIREGRYTAAQIDNLWTDRMWDEFEQWLKISESGQKYAYLDFSEDIAWMKFMRDHPEEARKQMNGPRTKNPEVREITEYHYTI